MKQMHKKNLMRRRKEMREQQGKQIARDVYIEAKHQQQVSLQEMEMQSHQMRAEAKLERDGGVVNLRTHKESQTRKLQQERRDAFKMLKKEELKLKRAGTPGLTLLIQRKRQEIEREHNRKMQLLTKELQKRRSAIDFQYRNAIRAIHLMRQKQRVAIGKKHADLVKKAPKLHTEVTRGHMSIDQASQQVH